MNEEATTAVNQRDPDALPDGKRVHQSQDYREGIRAFHQKRKSVFTGR
jgi:hypothetical protein